jgi:hypothetical protein
VGDTVAVEANEFGRHGFSYEGVVQLGGTKQHCAVHAWVIHGWKRSCVFGNASMEYEKMSECESLNKNERMREFK